MSLTSHVRRAITRKTTQIQAISQTFKISFDRRPLGSLLVTFAAFHLVYGSGTYIWDNFPGFFSLAHLSVIVSDREEKRRREQEATAEKAEVTEASIKEEMGTKEQD